MSSCRLCGKETYSLINCRDCGTDYCEYDNGCGQGHRKICRILEVILDMNGKTDKLKVLLKTQNKLLTDQLDAQNKLLGDQLEKQTKLLEMMVELMQYTPRRI